MNIETNRSNRADVYEVEEVRLSWAGCTIQASASKDYIQFHPGDEFGPEPGDEQEVVAFVRAVFRKQRELAGEPETREQRISLDSFRDHVRDQYGLLDGDSDALDDVFALAALGKRAEAVMRKVASAIEDEYGVDHEIAETATAWVEDFDRVQGEAPDMGDHRDAD